jgi:hypothetical protein
MTQYHVLASEGRQRYILYTQITLKIYRKKNNAATNVFKSIKVLETILKSKHPFP